MDFPAIGLGGMARKKKAPKSTWSGKERTAQAAQRL